MTSNSKKSEIANDILTMLDEITPVQMEFSVNNADCKNKKNGFDVNLTNEWKRSPSYSNSYEDEWYRLFKTDDISFETIQNLGLTGELRNCRFRSVCWRIYLEVISPNFETWIDEIKKHRQLYIDLRNKYVIDPRGPELDHSNIINDDPLSLEDESKWNKYFKSQDIMKEIKQDVVRTFPEIEFFHSSSVRTSMINVLYCFSQTSKLYYRQGMHEILAPLIFVLHCDHMAFEHSLELSNLSSSMCEVAGILLNNSFLEHDAYSIFSKLMSIIEPWYDGGSNTSSPINNVNVNYKKINIPELKPFEKPREIVVDRSSTQRLNHIHDNILKRHDLDLYLHLENLEISPQMFGLRWLKLLFGREYTMQDLLMVWDVLFAVDRTFSLVDYIYVSMLIHIRDYLLMSDFANCLTQLMRYPSNVDVNQIIDFALYLFNPSFYPKPTEPAHYHGISNYPMISLANSALKKKRAQRNKTIVGIETFANRLTSFINKKPPREAFTGDYNQERPTHLIYRRKIPSVSDSAPVTPTNTNTQSGVIGSQRVSDLQDFPVDVTDYLDINFQNQYTEDSDYLLQIISICSKLVNQSISDINFHNSVDKSSPYLDKAIATLKQTRDILNGNLTLNRKKLITELQYDRPSHIKRMNSPKIRSLNRSVSNNDITALRNSPSSNNQEPDLSEKLLRFLPNYNIDKSDVELKGFSSYKN